MRVTVRHGIKGDEELTTQVVAGVTVGWDLMEQMARKLALDSPFSDCFLLKLHCGDALSGANYQFANGAPRLRRYAIWCRSYNIQPPSTTKL